MSINKNYPISPYLKIADNLLKKLNSYLKINENELLKLKLKDMEIKDDYIIIKKFNKKIPYEAIKKELNHFLKIRCHQHELLFIDAFGTPLIKKKSSL